MTFFLEWQSWVQLTFVLMCAIVVVFIMAYMKLWWMQRYIKKHERQDEEDSRIQRLRQVKGMEDHIPFGIRAIESGIEVDGIWISKSSTLPTSSVTTTPVHTPPSFEDPPTCQPAVVEAQSPSRSELQQSLVSRNTWEPTMPAPERPVPSTSRSIDTYKPRQSSQLRYSALDPVQDDETLDSLEGRPERGPRKLVKSHRPQGMPELELGPAPNPAEREQLLDGADKPRSRSRPPISFPTSFPSFANSRRSSDVTDTPLESHSRSASLDMTSASPNAYKPVPLSSPRQSTSDSGRHSKSQSHHLIPDGYFAQWAAANNFETDANLPLMGADIPDEPGRPAYGPGEIHLGTANRQVNAGFQVLPAGTLSARPAAAEIMRESLDWPQRERRQSRKLQKKRASSSLSRASK